MVDADPFAFRVVSGETVQAILSTGAAHAVDVVRDAYLAHADGLSSNPPSHFLRFADRPRDRIIALPADLGADAGIAGIKWIASWPGNVGAGIQRASAVLVLNRRDTGYPYCLMEASIVSAMRTAASAVLGFECLGAGRLPANPRIGFIGCGPIARAIADVMIARGIRPARIAAYDLTPADARGFLAQVGADAAPMPADSAEALIRDSHVVVFATTAAQPHIHDPAWFAHAPLVLHISLRDLDPAIVLAADNVVDDVDHCLQAETSPHLAERLAGNRDFVTGTIAQAVRGALDFDRSQPLIYSPFGMGILDLALGRHVFDVACERGRAIPIPNFFANRTR